MNHQHEHDFDGALRTGAWKWGCCLVLVLGSCARHAGRATNAPAGSVNVPVAIAVDAVGNAYVSGRDGITRVDVDGRLTFLASGPISAAALVGDDEFLYYAAEGRIDRLKLSDASPLPISGGAPPVEHVAGLDVAGALLYVADAGANKIRMFDTTTGAAAGEFDVHAPQAVAVDPLGQIWVAHDHSVIQAFRADGYSGVTYGGLGDVSALTFGPGARLYAADAASGRVLVLDTGASPAQFVPVLNLGAEAGRLCAVVADNHGNLITLQRRLDGKGMRLAKYGADKKLIWEMNR